MDVSRIFLKTANSLLSAVIVLFLVVAGAYSAYALWDNMQVYASVDDIQSQLLKYKPTPGEDNGPTFEELRAINPDVCAWITLDGTKIDYPVLQGEDNLTYINKDVYGNFALAGSIFLDSNCDRSFQEKYSLLYGHHMAEHKMFGDLDLYEKQKFFDKNQTGTLVLPDRSYKLEIFACIKTSANEDNIFIPQKWQKSTDGLLKYAEKSAKYIHQDTMKKIVAINAGPRKGWNTDQLIKEAAKGSEFAGAEIEYVDLFRLEKYTGCISCFGCKRKGNFGKCVYKDGLYDVLEKIRNADGLIIGSPNYMGDVTASFRALFERLTFQYLTYNLEKPSYNEHLIPLLFILTRIVHMKKVGFMVI